MYVSKMAGHMNSLVNQAKQMEAKQSRSLAEAADVLNNLDKLAQLVSNIEAQNEAQKKLAEAADSIMFKMNQLAQSDALVKKQRDWKGSFKKVVNGTRVMAQVVDVVANGLDLVVDAAVKTAQMSGKRSQTDQDEKQNDLYRNLLNPMNMMLQSILNKPASAADEPQSASRK